VPALKTGTTPSDLVISEQLRLANENPGRQMEATFRTEDDGKLVGVVRVADRESLAGQMSLDNTGSASTGQWRLGAALQHHNLFDRDVVGTLQVQTSPGYWQEVQIVSASARVPLYGVGWMLDASAVSSSVDSGTISTAAGNYQLASEGANLSLRATNLLPRIGAWDQRISLGYDFKRVDSRVTTAPGGASLVPDIELRPVSLAYQGTWRDDALTVFALGSLSRNVPSGGRSAESVFAEPGLRLGANPYYRITRLTVSAAWPAWGGQASASFSGQWTPDALVPAEQFGIGGDGSIRGFNGRVASNDEGERIGVEWQSALRPWGAPAQGAKASKPSAPGQPPATVGLSMGWQVFVEAGQVRRNLVQANETPRTRLAAVGGGLRLLAFDRLSVRTDLGVVVRGDGLALRGDRFLHVAATVGF
jgi:hemolysin activation/secretion protein